MAKYYRVEAIIEDDRDEDDMGMYVEGVLEGRFNGRLKDLSVYAVML